MVVRMAPKHRLYTLEIAETDSAEIYALLCPETHEVRYIGKARDSQKRLKSHIRDARKRRHIRTPVYDWITSLAKRGLVPVVEVVVVVPVAEWPATERLVIARCLARGVRLLNVAEGGNEPFCPTDVRAENGRKNAALVHSDPKRKRIWTLKKNLGDALKRGHLSDANKAKLRLAAQRAPHLFGEWAAI